MGVFNCSCKIFFILLFLVSLCVGSAFAQAPTGAILGTVRDSSGGAVAGERANAAAAVSKGQF